MTFTRQSMPAPCRRDRGKTRTSEASRWARRLSRLSRSSARPSAPFFPLIVELDAPGREGGEDREAGEREDGERDRQEARWRSATTWIEREREALMKRSERKAR